MQTESEKREKLEAKAAEGNVTAIQMLDKMALIADIEQKKLELLSGTQYGKPENMADDLSNVPALPVMRGAVDRLNELDISEIERYIRKGDFRSLPEHMAVYIKWMELAHDWYYKFKTKNWIVKYLLFVCKDTDGNAISSYMANKVFTDMLSFFYSDQDFKKNSWMMYLAERVTMAAEMCWHLNDFKGFGDNIAKAADILQKITIDKQNIDPRLLERRPRYFLTDAKQLGVPDIDRNALARGIDEMLIPERVKQRAKQDLGVEKRDFGGDALAEEIEETK